MNMLQQKSKENNRYIFYRHFEKQVEVNQLPEKVRPNLSEE